MKELLEIIKTYNQAQAPMALATIVQTAGSSYRRPGARMLIAADGRTVGCISGGCLDQDVVLQGMEVIYTQKPALITYDTSSDRDVLFGAGLGCKGVVEILVEFLPATESPFSFINFLEKLIQQRQTGAAATVIKAQGKIGWALGDRVIVSGPGCRATSDLLTQYAQRALAGVGSEVINHEFPGGSAEIFVETFLPQTNVIIFGAGHDAMPLARMANELGFRISVVDARPGYATRDRFPLADEIVIARAEDDNWDRQLFDERTVAIVMTHNYLCDRTWLKRLLPMQLPYLGLMGPRKRAEKMLQELREEELEIGEEELASLHNPIGLDIGAETPEQIALAILAEIQAALTGHEGGKLRQKKGAIHLAQEAAACCVLA
jgi:xanthine dehydrogenase accessory factor